MIKNSLIRVDANNLVLLEIDTENHDGHGGIMDAEGNFYPFNSVVSPTHSSIVRFDDTNVVLIKLDPDTHDSSAIIMDEVSGQVYPLGPSGPVALRMEVGNILADGTLRNESKRLRAPDYYIPTGDKITVTGCPWGTWNTITNTTDPTKGGYFFRAYDADKNPCGSIPAGGFYLTDITDAALPAGTAYVRLVLQRYNTNIPNNWYSLVTDTFEINGVEYEVTE